MRRKPGLPLAESASPCLSKWKQRQALFFLSQLTTSSFPDAERRKVERRIRRTERTLRSLSDAGPGAQDQQAELNRQLCQLKEDLEYVRVRARLFLVCHSINLQKL
jgi:septal ring factor EnvC (AmiA/AmiB activator)